MPRSVCTGDAFLLVGNFGDGRMNVFSMATGAFIAPLLDQSGNTLEIDKLWGVYSPDNEQTILFVAGINDEADGLLGRLVRS